MPSIHVELFEGRSVEQKRALARALTDATVATLGGTADSVHIVFTDVARHDWATGGVLWSDRSAGTGEAVTADAAAAARPASGRLDPPPVAAD